MDEQQMRLIRQIEAGANDQDRAGQERAATAKAEAALAPLEAKARALREQQRAEHRASVLREAIDVAREEGHRLEESAGIEPARGARSVAYLLRKLLAKAQPATAPPTVDRATVLRAVEDAVYEYRELTCQWGETDGSTQEIARRVTQAALDALGLRRLAAEEQPCHAHCRTRCSRACPAPQVEGVCRWPIACDGPGCPGCLPMPIGVECTCPEGGPGA